jgi:simple sugar transport system substrate-binding protein
MKKIIRNLLGAVALAVGLTLASGAAQAAGHEKYILVSHATDSDSLWNTIKNALALEGKQMGVQV